MLYPKNQEKALSKELFRNPTSEYRGTPFWAWNCELQEEELLWQLEVLKEMGFGGAHMHVRTGMATPYLSDEHMHLLKACVEKCRKENMLAWLYDEDRWPSGAAGGLVTREVMYRARYLMMTVNPNVPDGELVACYDVVLDENGCLKKGKRIGAQEEAEGTKWYTYVRISPTDPWFNNQTYINALDKKAMQRFIEVTYERYLETVGEDFGGVVPAIFTDEPQYIITGTVNVVKNTLRFAAQKDDVTMPWTEDLPETFRESYGEEIMDHLPEILWELPDGQVSTVRYHFHDHLTERFAQAFADQCGNWCQEHGLMLTGHMLSEEDLFSQTQGIGEAMRNYRGFQLPGIDMLCNNFEYTTAKQAQSAVHQYGREGMTSELYGVTGWDFDFRGHKLHGDWQAALGVTIRVPHLSWVSMAGEAKRDYPASISYQSPWWEQYRLVEDHFARVNTAMTRGVPVVKVGVIHPVESYWLHWGPAEQTAMVRDELDQNFQNLTEWLLFGSVDFDFISESLLPTQCEKGGAPLQVGHMNYDVILVPGCETLRASTLERLEAFAAAGGKLIFAGQIPTLVDARPSSRPAELAAKCQCIPLSEGAVLQAAEAGRVVEIRNQTGSLTKNLLYQMRQDGDGRWLFICNAKEPYNKDVARYQDLRIRVAGGWKPTLYQTMDGTTAPVEFETADGQTEIRCRMYDYDSMLLYLEPCEAGSYAGCEGNAADGQMLKLPVLMDYTLSEPNALLLDQAEYALDDEEWQPCEEILRLDNVCREKLSWPTRKEALAQPWVVPDEPITHSVKLRFTFNAAYAVSGASLAIEDAERLQLSLNGAAVPAEVTGWYTDKSIKTIALPELKAGENVLEVVVPFGRRTNLEWCYILGDFGVEVSGRYACIVPAREKIAFGDFTRQGLPFYGGNVTYHIPVTTVGGELTLRSSHYRGALQKVSVDGGEAEAVIYPPYTVSLGSVPAGEHVIDLTLYGHRRNSFGPVHLADLKETWIGPGAWRSEGDRWCYDYKICEEGILSTPEIIEK